MARTDRMTDRARCVVSLAEGEVKQRGAAAVEPEHLLLGIVLEAHGIAGNVLQHLNIGLADIAAVLPPAPRQPMNPSHSIAWSDRAELAVARAHVYAAEFNHNYVGTEHLLLGVVLTGAGRVPEILQRAGLSAEQVRREVYNLLGHEL